MTIGQVMDLARRLMDQHGLQGWAFELTNAKTTLGLCHYGGKKITLSKWFVMRGEELEVIDTILHEIAHAIAVIRHGFAGRGHGKVWKDICKEIGANPQRVASPDAYSKEIEPPYKWTAECCGNQFGRHRLSRLDGWRCKECKTEIVWSKNR